MRAYRNLFVCAAGITAFLSTDLLRADISSSPMVVFTKTADQKPYFSQWTGSTWSAASGTAMSSVGANPYFVVLQNCPVRDEMACATQDSTSDVNVMFYNGSSWSGVTEVCDNVPTSGTRGFSLAYENLSGNCMVVYVDNTEGNLGYRIWNGSTLSAETDLDMPSGIGDLVTLNSRPGTNQIFLSAIKHAGSSSNYFLYVNVWSGSAWMGWTNVGQLEKGNPEEDYAIATEGSSGDSLLVYGIKNSSTPGYRTWDGSAWSAESTMPNIGAIPSYIRLAADPLSDQILFAALDAANDINVNVWNGSSWGTDVEVESNAQFDDRREFDIAYENGTGKALLVYQENGQTSLRYRTWSGSSWSAEQTGAAIGNAGRCIQLRTSLNDGEIFIAASDEGDDMEMMRWNGISMSATQQLCGTMNGTSTTEPFMLATPAERKTTPASIPYSNDFQSTIGMEWNSAKSTTNATLTIFAGQHRAGPLKLALTTTPGETYDVYFDFYAIDSWNGSTGTGAPDYFSVNAGTTQVFNETFSHEYAATQGASYPYPYDQMGHYGFNGSYQDAVYRKVQCTFTASSSTTILKFCGSLTDESGTGYNDESWGIDNISVNRADFIDVTASTGFNFLNTTSADTYGGGMCWADLDNDGDLDCILSGNTGKLILNNSAGTSFSSASFPWSDFRNQTVLVDIDNDGDLDVWSPAQGGANTENCALNNGSASFTSSGNYGFSAPSTNEAAAIADVNADGWPDVVMFSSNANYIAHNQGVSPVSLVGTSAASYGMNTSGDYGDGDYCSSGDVNNDGRPDFFYHFSGGKLFVSNGDGTYTANNRGISVSTGSSKKIGSAWADYDNDGDLDLFVCKYDESCTGYLWRNDRNWAAGTGSFTDVTSAAGISLNTVINYSPAHPGSRSVAWGDYDNDGDQDLFVLGANGANYLYQNNGNGTFTRVCNGIVASGTFVDCCFVDYDNDGDLDLALTRENGSTLLFANRTNNSNYLKVRVTGRGAGGTNKPGIGTRIELYNAAGTTLLARRDVGNARGFGGMSPMWVHFGGLSPTTSYVIKTYLNSTTNVATVTPGTTSSTIGSRTIAQMKTVDENTVKIVRWSEVTNSP